MSLTQTGPGVGQTGSSSLSAGFFVQQTLVGIRLAHNAAHWRPLPDFRGQCPHAEECADKLNSAGLNEVLLFKKKKKITNTGTFFLYRGQDLGHTHFGTRSPFSSTTWHQDPTGKLHFSNSQSFSVNEKQLLYAETYIRIRKQNIYIYVL